MNKFSRVASGVGIFAGLQLLGMQAAHAVLDTTDIIAATDDATAAVAVVGLAVLVVLVGAKVFKWVRAAL